METFEGVYLSFEGGVVGFMSGLNGGLLAAKNLSDFQRETDIIDYMDSMSERKWWPHVKKRFEREAFSRFNRL